MEHLVNTGASDICAGLTGELLELLDPEWDENKITEEIVKRLWDNTYGWKFTDNIKGISSLLDHLYQNLVLTTESIPETLPEGYPLEETLNSLYNIINTIKNQTPFNQQPSTEWNLYWQIPGNCNTALSPFNPMLIGTSSNAVKLYKATIDMYQAQELISELRTYTCMAWTIGGGGVKIAVSLTGAGAPPAEAIYWSGIGVCGAAGTVMAGTELVTKLALLYELWDVEGKIASDINMTKEFFKSLLGEITLLIEEGAYSCSAQVNIENTYIPNLSVDIWDDVGAGTAEVTVKNLHNEKSAAAHVLLEITPEKGDDPISLFASEEYTIEFGSSQTIPIYFEAPSPGLFFSDRYNAKFTTLTSGGVFASQGSFTV